MQKPYARLANLAMLSAVAFVAMLVTRLSFIPAATYLEYEAKDVIIAIAGFLYGPIEALCSAVVVTALQMVTVSTTGPYGFLMNLFAASSFACTASLVYSRRRTIYGAAAGLAAGAVALTAAMLLWNYIITPLYLSTPRAVVAGMLVPVFLPFNLIKGSLNAAIAFLLYKPLSNALRAAKLLPPRAAGKARPKPMPQGAGAAQSVARAPRPARLWLMAGAALVALLCVAAIVALRNGLIG